MTPHEAIAAKFKQLEAMAADPSLTSAELRIGILLLTRYFNIADNCAWPSRERLAADTGASRATVSRAIDGLEAKDWFTVQRNKGRGNNNRYYPAFLFQQDEAEKGSRMSPITDNEETNPEKGSPLHEKGSPLHIKGLMPAHKRAHACGNTSFKKPIKTSLKTSFKAQPLASPPEGGSRPLPNDSTSLETPCEDEGKKEARQNISEEADNGDTSSTPSLKLRAFGLHVNERRPDKKDTAYWKQKKLSKEAAEMSPADREAFWCEKLSEDDKAATG
jgi:hypothetical protein